MKDNFNYIMDKLIFPSEGGYSDHPRDPGGATNMGITIGTLRAYRGKAVTKADVRALTKDEAREIYRKNYWNKVSGDLLPDGVDAVTMDSAVNSGVGRGAYWLQRAVGAKVDRKIGAETLKMTEAATDTVTINRMCDDRMNFLRSLGTWPTFGKGWSRRVTELRAVALQMARNAPEREVEPVDTIEPDTPMVPTQPAPSSPVEGTGKVAGIAAVIGAAAMGVFALIERVWNWVF